MQRILVTGGAGFIGRALVARLAPSARVTVVDCLDEQVHDRLGFPDQLQALAHCIKADVRKPHEFEAELGDADIVIHLAAQTGTAQSMYELDRYVSSNVGGTSSLLEWLIKNERAPRVVLASSRAVYGEGTYQSATGLRPARRTRENLERRAWEPVDDSGNPVRPLPMRYGHPTEPSSLYGLTKLWQEQLVRSVCEAHEMDYAILRFQNVFGPGQAINNPYTGIIGMLTRQMIAGEEIELFEDGRVTRDFIFVDDAARALERAAMSPTSRVTVDVGSGNPVELRQVAEMLAEILEISPATKTSGFFRLGDVRHASADMSGFTAAYGELRPMALLPALQKYCEWFRSEPVSADEKHSSAMQELNRFGILGVSA